MAVLTKTRLGGNYLSDGWVAHSWGAYQECIWLMGQSWKSCWWWIIKLIKKLWNVAWDMWEYCNSALCNLPQAQHNIVESRATNDTIRAHYVHRPQALPREAMHLMAQPMEYQLALLLAEKQQWLELNELRLLKKPGMTLVITCWRNGLCRAGWLFNTRWKNKEGQCTSLYLNVDNQSSNHNNDGELYSTWLNTMIKAPVPQDGQDAKFLIFHSFHLWCNPGRNKTT